MRELTEGEKQKLKEKIQEASAHRTDKMLETVRQGDKQEFPASLPGGKLAEKLAGMDEQRSTAGIGATQSSRPVQSNEARISLILGFMGLGSVFIVSILFSAFWLPALAIVFGVRGLRTINKKGGVLQFTGKGLAIAGILLGIFSYIILMLGLIIGISS